MAFPFFPRSKPAKTVPPVEARVSVGPVNTNFFVAGVSGWLAMQTYPQPGSDWQADILFGFFCLISAGGVIKGLRLMFKDYALRRDLALASVVTTNFGSARQATKRERKRRGMDDSRKGDLLGLDEKNKPVFRPEKTPFGLFEMPPGVGKTASYVIGSILHHAMRGDSTVIADCQNVLGPMLAMGLRNLGFEVWCINANQSHLEACGDVELNPYQALVDAVYEDGPGRMDAAKHAADYAHIHYPPVKDDKNPYFVNGSRRAISAGALETALTDPARCTPTALYQKLTDPALFAARMERAATRLQSARKDDPLIDFMRGEARNLLHRAKHNPENFGSFLEGASQRLLSFNPSGRLAHYGSTAIRNIAEIRERQIIVFIMTPLSHMREFADFISLLNHNVIAACKSNPSGHSVHIVAEEALNYRFSNLISDLETMRQLNVTADFYIQSYAGLEKQYGKDAAQAIESYADVRVYAGLNSLARAKHVSEMLNEATIRKQDHSIKVDTHDLNLSGSEVGRSLMKPNEILAMSPRHAWVFVRGMNPMMLRMVHYGQVAPWRDWVAPHPSTGERLYGKPVVTINYPKREEQ